jgi:hypothetical protein
MDLGLGNLTELKAHLLASGIAATAKFDNVIAAIGKGVAAQFERYCNRKFARVVGDKETISADRTIYILPRSPIETITQIETRDDTVAGWVVQQINTIILNQDESKGLIEFGYVAGIQLSKLRITYTGGYWYDTSEDGSGLQPNGSTLLPHDLKLAWFLQCQEVWNRRDKLGTSIADKPTNQVQLDGLDLIPQVKTILTGLKRYQMT